MVEVVGNKTSLIQLKKLFRDYPSLTAVGQVVDGLLMQPVFEARDGMIHLSFTDLSDRVAAHIRAMPNGRPNSFHQYEYCGPTSKPTVVKRKSHYFGQPPKHGLIERGGSGVVKSYLVPYRQISAGTGNGDIVIGPRIKVKNGRTKTLSNGRAQVLNRAVPGGAIFIPVELVQDLVCLPNRTGRVMPTVPSLVASLTDDGGSWRTNFGLAAKRGLNDGVYSELGISPQDMWLALVDKGYEFPFEKVRVNGFSELVIPEELISSFYVNA